MIGRRRLLASPYVSDRSLLTWIADVKVGSINLHPVSSRVFLFVCLFVCLFSPGLQSHSNLTLAVSG